MSMRLRREKLKTYSYNTIEHYWSQIQEDAKQESLVVVVLDHEDKSHIDDLCLYIKNNKIKNNILHER